MLVAVEVGVGVKEGGISVTSALWLKITGRCVLSGKAACAAITRTRVKNIARNHFNFAETISVLYNQPRAKNESSGTIVCIIHDLESPNQTGTDYNMRFMCVEISYLSQ
jgi:hypothetical protein